MNWNSGFNVPMFLCSPPGYQGNLAFPLPPHPAGVQANFLPHMMPPGGPEGNFSYNEAQWPGKNQFAPPVPANLAAPLPPPMNAMHPPLVQMQASIPPTIPPTFSNPQPPLAPHQRRAPLLPDPFRFTVAQNDRLAAENPCHTASRNFSEPRSILKRPYHSANFDLNFGQSDDSMALNDNLPFVDTSFHSSSATKPGISNVAGKANYSNCNAQCDSAYQRFKREKVAKVDKVELSRPFVDVDERPRPAKTSFFAPSNAPPPPPPPKQKDPKPTFVSICDLLDLPGRNCRPPAIVVILRGLPGSGKTFVTKLIKDRELERGGCAPRILCLDDYFLNDDHEYEYEAEMEEAYRKSLFKTFKKTVDEGFFSVIIYDAINQRVRHFDEFWSYAKSKGFQVYVAELDIDLLQSEKRNVHKRTRSEIEAISAQWEKLPSHFLRLDLRPLLQDAAITEVEMEDCLEPDADSANGNGHGDKGRPNDDAESDSDDNDESHKSKWEVDASEEKLDRLDGLSIGMRKHEVETSGIEDFLNEKGDELDVLDSQQSTGKKRVRWADLEEQRNQTKRRQLGFVVGQTQEDWQRITDDDFAYRALNRTKYI